MRLRDHPRRKSQQSRLLRLSSGHGFRCQKNQREALSSRGGCPCLVLRRVGGFVEFASRRPASRNGDFPFSNARTTRSRRSRSSRFHVIPKRSEGTASNAVRSESLSEQIPRPMILSLLGGRSFSSDINMTARSAYISRRTSREPLTSAAHATQSPRKQDHANDHMRPRPTPPPSLEPHSGIFPAPPKSAARTIPSSVRQIRKRAESLRATLAAPGKSHSTMNRA